MTRCGYKHNNSPVASKDQQGPLGINHNEGVVPGRPSATKLITLPNMVLSPAALDTQELNLRVLAELLHLLLIEHDLPPKAFVGGGQKCCEWSVLI